MKLEEVFRSVARKLEIDFKHLSSEIHHRASKGRVREVDLVEQFLGKYLPRTVGIGHGEVVSSAGDVSSESDIILYESRTSPTFIEESGYQVFPVECIYGVVEVKSRLDKRELEDAFSKITKLKKFPKIAYEPQEGDVSQQNTMLYDRRWPYFPTLGFVFGYEAIDLRNIRQYLDELHRGTEVHHRIDSVWVLNKGMVLNYIDGTRDVSHTPSHATSLKAVESENPLLLMTIHLQQLLQAGWMPKFRIADYLREVDYGRFME